MHWSYNTCYIGYGWGDGVNKKHYYFTNPKYMYSHICLKRSGMWMVFEIKKVDEKHHYPLDRPVAIGASQGEAIENASAIKGIKHYMIKVVDDDG